MSVHYIVNRDKSIGQAKENPVLYYCELDKITARVMARRHKPLVQWYRHRW